MTTPVFSTDQLAEMAAAYFSRNKVPLADVPAVLQAFQAGADLPKVEAALVPAVAISKSVRKDKLVCLECGAELASLKRHLATKHGLSVPAYKERWGLPKDYPTTAPEYSARRSALAKDAGLGK